MALRFTFLLSLSLSLSSWLLRQTIPTPTQTGTTIVNLNGKAHLGDHLLAYQPGSRESTQHRSNASGTRLPMLAPITIDQFTTNQTTIPAPPSGSSTSSTGGTDIIGTRRGMVGNLLSGAGPSTIGVSGGSLNFNVTNTTPDSRGEAIITWDGDTNPTTLTPTGLGGVNLASGGNNAFRLSINSATAGTEITFDVYTNGSNASRGVFVLPSIATPTDFFLNFISDFVSILGTGADFSSVGAIVMTVRGTEKSCSINQVLVDITSPNIPTPTQTGTIITDPNGNNKADPSDKIRYTVTIQNTGSSNATGVKLQANPDARTTLDGASFRTSPVAVNDGPYACTGNVGINIPAASGVKLNDYDDALASATLSVVTAPANGSVTLNNDGSFTYTPNAGYTGNDQFTYEIADATAVAGHTPANTDIRGTVSIAVSNMIWFIDNSYMGATSDGRRNTPFKTLAAFNSGSTAAGDVVYIEHTGTNYTGGIVLQNNERLFGEGHTGGANLADVLPFGLAANSFTLPTINSSRPVIENAGGDGVTLADGNTLRGFNVGACSDFGIENSGTTTVGNLVVSEVTINNTTGGGFDASDGSGASMSAVFDAITSNGGTNGINLTACGGTFTCNGGTITNPTGSGVLISGGTVTFSSSGAITDNTGFAVDVDNHDSNNVTFSGNITSTGTGIRVQNCGAGTKLFSGSSKSLSTGANTAVTLSSNSGATINFTGGGLAITTTSGTGFNATGGATAITVQGSGNTISSTTGTALNVANTTIGASGLNFQSINKNGGTNNGIALNGTGAGSLTVSGTGSAGSGGTLENIVGADAVSLNNVGGAVTFNYLIIEDISHANDASATNNTVSTVDGIHGQTMGGGLTLGNCIIRRISDSAINGTGANTTTATTWSGLSINNCTFENCNRFNLTNKADQDGEGIVHILGISGTVSVLNSTLQNGARGLHLYSHTSGSINMTVQNTDFLNLYKDVESLSDSYGYIGIEVRMFGSCNAVVRIGDPNQSNAALGCQFTNCNTASIGIFPQDATYTGLIQTVISKNIFTVTDHLSPGTLGTNTSFDGEFPQGGVLLSIQGGTMEGIFSNNEFHDCMHANGGVGNLTIIAQQNSTSEFIVTGNTFDGPWDFIAEIRTQDNNSCAMHWANNIMPFKNLTAAQCLGTELENLGLTSQPLPFESMFIDVRQGGDLDLTIQNETVPDHDRANNSFVDFSYYIRTQASSGILNLEMDNNKATNGYQFVQNGGTFNLFKDLSVNNTVQTVLQDNGNRGGSVNPNTNPPVVNVTGTITLSMIDPVLPNITIP